MKKSSIFGNACGLAALGLSPLALAGEETAAVEAESSNPWTLEASLLYLEARAETYDNQDFEAGYRLGLGYQPDGSSWGYRLRLMDHEGSNRGGGVGHDLAADGLTHRFAVEQNAGIAADPEIEDHNLGKDF